MSRRIHILLAFLCLTGFGVSFVQLLTADSETFTAEQALVLFLQHGIEFQNSVWVFFTIGFLLCTAFWVWRLFTSRYEPYA